MLNSIILDIIHRIPFLCLYREQSMCYVEIIYKCNIWHSTDNITEMYKVQQKEVEKLRNGYELEIHFEMDEERRQLYWR